MDKAITKSNFTFRLMAGIYGIQAVIATLTASLGTACPAWLKPNTVFIPIYLLPLAGVPWAMRRMDTRRGRILMLLLAPAGSLVVLVVFSVIGAALSLFLFGTFSMDGIQ
ncbi:MAG: hypothetical protein ACOYD3_13220 [Kiritimatiellia bacterium]|jgi:hypothetical protein